MLSRNKNTPLGIRVLLSDKKGILVTTVIVTGMMVLSKASSGFVMSLGLMEPDIIGFAFIDYQSHNLKTFP